MRRENDNQATQSPQASSAEAETKIIETDIIDPTRDAIEINSTVMETVSFDFGSGDDSVDALSSRLIPPPSEEDTSPSPISVEIVEDGSRRLYSRSARSSFSPQSGVESFDFDLHRGPKKYLFWGKRLSDTQVDSFKNHSASTAEFLKKTLQLKETELELIELHYSQNLSSFLSNLLFTAAGSESIMPYLNVLSMTVSVTRPNDRTNNALHFRVEQSIGFKHPPGSTSTFPYSALKHPINMCVDFTFEKGCKNPVISRISTPAWLMPTLLSNQPFSVKTVGERLQGGLPLLPEPLFALPASESESSIEKFLLPQPTTTEERELKLVASVVPVFQCGAIICELCTRTHPPVSQGDGSSVFYPINVIAARKPEETTSLALHEYCDTKESLKKLLNEIKNANASLPREGDGLYKLFFNLASFIEGILLEGLQLKIETSKLEDNRSFALSNFFLKELQLFKQLITGSQVKDIMRPASLISKIQSVSEDGFAWQRLEFSFEEIQAMQKFLKNKGENELSAKLLDKKAFFDKWESLKRKCQEVSVDSSDASSKAKINLDLLTSARTGIKNFLKEAELSTWSIGLTSKEKKLILAHDPDIAVHARKSPTVLSLFRRFTAFDAPLMVHWFENIMIFGNIDPRLKDIGLRLEEYYSNVFTLPFGERLKRLLSLRGQLVEVIDSKARFVSQRAIESLKNDILNPLTLEISCLSDLLRFQATTPVTVWAGTQVVSTKPRNIPSQTQMSQMSATETNFMALTLRTRNGQHNKTQKARKAAQDAYKNFKALEKFLTNFSKEFLNIDDLEHTNPKMQQTRVYLVSLMSRLIEKANTLAQEKNSFSSMYFKATWEYCGARVDQYLRKK